MSHEEKESRYWFKLLRLLVGVFVFYSVGLIITSIWGSPYTITQYFELLISGVIIVTGIILYHRKWRNALALEAKKE